MRGKRKRTMFNDKKKEIKEDGWQKKKKKV